MTQLARLHRCCALAALLSPSLLVLSLPGRALADKSTPDVEARRHFEEGTKAFNLGEFAQAVEEYRAAYKARPDPVFLYNVAQAYRQANDLSQAIFFYKSYLRNTTHAPNRREVERRIVDLQDQLDHQHALTSAPPFGPAAPGAPVAASPAKDEPRASDASTSSPPSSSGAPAPAVVDLTAPSASAASAAAPPIAAAPERATPVYKKWWLWTIVGVAVAGGVVAGVVVGTQGGTKAPASSLGAIHVF